MLLNRHSKPVPGNVILDCIGNEEGEIFLIYLLFSERYKRNIVKSSQELNLFFFFHLCCVYSYIPGQIGEELNVEHLPGTV